MGWLGREVESTRQFSLPLLLEMESKVMGPDLPPSGRAEIYKRAGLSLQSFPGSAPKEIVSVRRAGSHPISPAPQPTRTCPALSFWMTAELHVGQTWAFALPLHAPCLWITGVVHFPQRTERTFQELQNHSELMGAGSPNSPWGAMLPQHSSSPEVHCNWDSYGTG